MKYFLMIVVSFFVLIAGYAMASPLVYDGGTNGNSTPIQGFAPDPYASVDVNGPISQLFDVKNRIAWSFYNTGSECIGRILPSKDKGKFPKFPINSGERYTFVVNKKVTFLNLSGCTGHLMMQ